MNLFDEHVERSVLGGLLMDGIAAMEDCLRLRPEMFYLPSHQTIFRRLSECLSKDSHVTEVMFADVLTRHGELDAVGGLTYLMELPMGLPARWNAAPYAAKIVECWRRRMGVSLCQRNTTAFEAGDDSTETFARMQTEVMHVMQDGAAFDDPSILANTLPELERWRSTETPEGIPYGLANLDRLTGGMHPGEITILGARNGVGKTSLMVQLAASCCARGEACDVFSMEMRRGSILRRLWAMESGVRYRVLRHPEEAEPFERRAVGAAALRCAEWPLRIFDKSGMDVSQIAAFARMGARREENPVKVVCVDYAQIVSGSERDDRMRVAKVSRTLTALAKDEGIHVVLLSQLRKVPIEQYGKAPTLADLRETGQLGDDAHVVLLLHRPYDAETHGLSEAGELIIPKQREGDTGMIQVQYNRRSLTFA